MMFVDGATIFGGGLLNISVVGLLIFSIIYFIQEKRLYYSNSLTRSIIIFLIYIWIISVLWGGFPNNLLIIETILPIVIFMCSLVAARSYEHRAFLFFVIIVYMVLSCYYVTTYQKQVVNELVAQQNNASYTLLLFVPFILCIRNNIIKIIGVVITFCLMLISLKRGGLIAFLSALSVYYIVLQLSKNKGNRILLIAAIISVLLPIIIDYLFISDNHYLSIAIDRFENIREDNGSGRIDIYSKVLEKIEDSNLFNTLFGHGWNSVADIPEIRLSAHNDFLETQYDFGLIALFLFIVVLYRIVRYIKNAVEYHVEIAAPLAASFTITLIMCSVSHIVIYPKYLLLTCLFWGFSIGEIQMSINREKKA